MSSREMWSAFEQMNDSLIRANLAFFATDFSDDALKVLKEVAAARGITEDSIYDQRETSYPDMEFIVKCGSCKCALQIDRDCFVEGEYVCPSCDTVNSIDYMQLEAPPSAMANMSDFMLGGGTMGAIREHLKRDARRTGILDGTYWENLKKITSLAPDEDH